MRMLMPSQAKKVQSYREATPLFVKYKVEDHLSQIYSPVVPLRSGGYLVINQTEALVAVDVNSGRSTRERNIEATALKTNMEAAEEAARQLRLRDLAGLIVIDFIDMDESKNNRAVEKKLKDCLKDDRARVQMGKISAFGLMEISRQRRRTGVLEGTTHVCEHCGGTGRVRSVESSALAALRALEIEALRGGGEATLTVPPAVALYILNEKRNHLARLQQGLGLFVTVTMDDGMAHAEHQIERTSSETRAEHAATAQAPLQGYEALPEPDLADDEDEEVFEDEEDEIESEASAEPRGRREAEVVSEEDDVRRGRRRRRRGRRSDEPHEAREAREPGPRPEAQHDDEEGGHGRRRRRGRRGGRRMRDEARPGEAFGWTRPWVPYGDDPFVWYDPADDLKQPQQQQPANAAGEPPRAAAEAAHPAPVVAPRPSEAAGDEEVWVELPMEEEKPKRGRRTRGRGRRTEDLVETPAESAAEPPAPAPAPEPEPAPETVAAAPPVKRTRARKKAPEPAPAVAAAPEPAREPEPARTPEPVAAAPVAAEPDPAEINAPPAAPRRGWWRRG
jgi:ribonuclease E